MATLSSGRGLSWLSPQMFCNVLSVLPLLACAAHNVRLIDATDRYHYSPVLLEADGVANHA